MASDKRNRRRRYIVDRDFQVKFILKFCALIVAASLLTGILIYYFNRQTTTVAFENLKVVVKSTSDFILPITLQILITVTLLVGIATMLVALFASHKIAGPLYRIKQELQKIKAGDLSSTIRVRKGDQLRNVASELDEVRIGFKKSVKSLKDDWDSIKMSLDQLKKEIKDEKEKKHITDNIQRIDSEFARFKID